MKKQPDPMMLNRNRFIHYLNSILSHCGITLLKLKKVDIFIGTVFEKANNLCIFNSPARVFNAKYDFDILI